MASKFAEDYKRFMEAHPEADAVRKRNYATPDEYEENERQRRELRNRLDNYYRSTGRQPARHQQTDVPSHRQETGEDITFMDRVRNYFAQNREDRYDRIAEHNAQAAQMGIQPMYDVDDAASAYLGYMQLPEGARNPQTEEFYRMLHEGSQANLEKRVEAARQQNLQQGEQWFADHEAMYANITQNPDFAENIDGWDDAVQFAQTTPEAEAYRNYMMYTPEGMRDPELERQLREAAEASTAQQEADVFQMSDEQKQIYQYLRNTRGKRAAEEYKDYISYTINAESVNNVRQSADYGAEDNGWDRVGRTILSSPANVLGSGFGALDIVGQHIRNRFGEYRPIDYNRGAQEMGEWAQSVREHTMDDMGNTGDFLYGVGTSMLDSWTALGIGVLTGSPQVGTALLGLSAARQGMQDAAQAGATDSQAVAIGMFNGVAEFLMENIGIDNLYSILTDSGVKGFKNIVRTILGQSFAEASEEGLTTLANTMGDAVIMGDKSQINRTIAELVAQGMPEQEARYEAIRQWFRQLGMDMLAGGLSGAGSGGIGVGANVLANRRNESQQAAQFAQTVANTETFETPVQEQVLAEPVALAETQPVAAAETAQETPMQTAEEVVEQVAKPTQAVSEAENTAQKTAPRTFKLRAKNKSGETLEITDVTIGQDTNLAFVTADGKEVSADDMDFKGNPKTMQIVKASANLNEDGARGLVTNYDGGDVMPYVRSYDLAYREGMANEDMQSVRQRVSNLSDEAFQAAYRAGQIERTMNADTAEIRGGVIRSYTKQPTKNQARSIEVLDAMFRAIGRTVEIVDSIDITDSNGNVIRKSGSNAQFDEATNRYKIALDAQDEALLNVAVHETIHDIEKNAKAEFDALRDLVFKWLEMNGEDIDTLRQRQRALMDGQSDAYYDAEIVANTVPRIFSNRQTFEQFVDKFMKEQPESEKRAFMRMVNRVLEFIKDALRKLSEYSSWAQVKQLRAQHDMLQAVRDQYFEALDVATRQEAQGDGETRNLDVKHSLRGVNKHGIEVYETSADIMNMSWKARRAKYLDIMKRQYRRRTARFERNGHIYYALFDQRSVRKHIYGEDRHSDDGLEALINAGADGDVFDLVERAKYTRSKKNEKNHTKADYFDYFVKTVQIDGKVFDLIADVEKKYFVNGGYVYTLALVDNNKIEASPALGTSDSMPVNGAGNTSMRRIAQGGSPVNRNIRNSVKDDTYMSAVESGDMETAQRMVDEAARDAGYTVKAYHGTRRADRVGTVFLPERATSGPMAYFTDSRDIAERYSHDKQDTSIAYDPDFDQYETQFRAKSGSSDVALYTLWNRLPIRTRQTITRKAEQLRQDWDNDYELILDPDTNEANGGFQWQLKEARGNAIKALIEQWLNSGTLYNQEADFMDVLEMAGVTEAVRNAGLGEVYFKDHDARYDKVYDTYLKITNPFDTVTVDEAFVDGLVEWYEENDEGQWDRESADSDPWDKNNIDAYDFAERLRDDIENGTSRAWTFIPDSVTDYLKSLGHDGITDAGGKNGGESHTVWIPFTSEQIKSADPVTYDDNGNVIPLSERFNPEQQDIRYSTKDVDVEALQAENAQLRAANAELAAQMKRTKGVNLDERAIRRFAQKLVKREGSTFDAGQLANSLSLIYDDMANADDLTDEDAARIIQSGTRLARQVLERARYFDQDGYDADSAVREFLRDTAVEIPAEYDDAIKRMATNRTAYRAQTRGVLNIVGKGKGVSIDQLWQSGSEDFPTVFSENVTNPEDMVEQLFVIAQGLKEDAYFGDNPYADDLDTAANILFLEMQAELMNIPRVQTLADKAAEAAKANRRADRAEKAAERAEQRKQKSEARYEKRREDANRRKYRDRVTRTANSLYQWAAKPNSKNYIPETMRLTVVKMLRALDMEGRMVEEAPKPPTHPGENATKEQMSAYRARETVYKRRLEAYQTKTQAKTTQSILWEQRMLKFADEMQKARGAENGASSFAASTDPDLPDAIRNYFKENPHVHLATMNAAQMKELSELLSRIEKAVTSENKRHAEYRNQTIAQTAADTKTAWREREEANETVLGKISTSKLAMAQMDAMNTAHMLGGGAQSIIQELRDGEDVFIEHIEEAKQVLEPEIKKLNKGRLSSTKVVQTPEGKYTHAIVLHSTDGDVTLTRAQVMSLYCLNKREQARGHLYGGGIVSTRDGKKRTYRLTEQQVQEACGHLTDTERGVADVMQNLLSTVCAEWGNEATMELYGYKKFREKFYFPISTVELGRDVAYDPNASETTIAQRGFSQNTQENATNAIYIGDVLTVVSKHVADMAEYGAYLTRISDAMRWLNYRGYTDADGTNYVNVKAELVRAFPGEEHRSGKDADKSAMEVYITDLIRSINGGASRTGTSNAITRLAKGAAVGANVSVAIQQVASYARAGVLLSARDLAFAKLGVFSKKERELMHKHAPITLWKSYGFFQAGTGRNVEALLRGDDNFYQTLREKQGLLAEIADNNAWLRLWNACKHEQKRLHKDMDHNSDEFYRLVGKRLSEVIDRTQVVDSPFHRAPIVNDPRYVTLTAFQSEVFKSFGVAQSCTYDVVLDPKSKKAWKALGKGVSAHVTAQILAGWLSAAWSAFIRDKDEEKDDELVERWLIKWGWIKPTGKYTRWEKFLVQGVQRSLGNLNPMRLHWIGNKVADVIENGFAGAFFGNDSVDNSFFNSISKFIAESIRLTKNHMEGKETDPTNLITHALSAGSYGTGIGFSTAIRDAKGIARLIKDIFKPEAYTPTMDDVFYYAETGVNEDDMSQVLAAETAKVQEDYPSYSADKAERTARGKLRSEITSEYKEAYAQAFAEGDKETMREIRQFMADTGLYIDGTEPLDACERWLRDYFKNQYLEATTDEERKEARRLLGRSGYYDSPRELSEAIEGWTE